jgi:DNA-3-methyladenine glycosylase II
MHQEAQTPSTFSSQDFHAICDEMGARDPHLKQVLEVYGYPQMWTRPNTFETLVHIILEQQVSLASAQSALTKLQARLQSVTPENLLLLADDELKACYFSRQKMKYVRLLAEAMQRKHLNLGALEHLPDEVIRHHLTSLKGIGNWTVDVYLMFVLQRIDVFPLGDLAAVQALKQLKKLPKETSKEIVIEVSDHWRPFRTIATMILWHYYLSLRKKS